MKTVCAWCGVLLKGDARDPLVSHGICRACFKAQTGREPKSNPRRSKKTMKCKNPCHNPRHRHQNPWNAQQLDGVARLATSVYSGARTFGFANPGLTLAGWAKKYGQRVFTHSGGAKYVFNDVLTQNTDARWDLFHLSDYAVSSSVAGVVWLVSTKSANPPACWNCGSSVSGDVCRKCWAGQTDDNPPRKNYHPHYPWYDPSVPHLVGNKVYKNLAAARKAVPGFEKTHIGPMLHEGRRGMYAGRPDLNQLLMRWETPSGYADLGGWSNPRRSRKHKPGCACAACSAHRKKVGRRTGASRASNPASPHVKALDKFIAKNRELSARCRRIQQRLHGALKVGRYSRSNAAAEWRGLIDHGCRVSRIPLSAAHRAQMAKQVADAFERKIRHGNPSVAIVGAGLNPGNKHQNPTDSRKKGDRGYVGTISLAEARKRAVAAGMGRQFDENVRAHKKFHGSAPSGVRVYRSNDGKKARTVEVGSISGRVPETTYISGKVVDKSNKANRFYVHKHPANGQPVEVWLAHKKSALKVGGTQKRTSWYYH